MKHEKESVLKEELGIVTITTHDRSGLIQKKMGSQPAIGKGCCSYIGLVNAICGVLPASRPIDMQKHPRRFLLAVRVKFEERDRKGWAAI